MYQVEAGHNAVLKTSFRDNKAPFDPVEIKDVQVYTPSGELFGTYTPVRLDKGSYKIVVENVLHTGIWTHVWTWKASSGLDYVSSKYRFLVYPKKSAEVNVTKASTGLILRIRALSMYYLDIDFITKGIRQSCNFLLYRGDSFNGPWFKLTPEPIDYPNYVDHLTPPLNLASLPYYFAQAVWKGEVIATSQAATLSGLPSLAGLSIASRIQRIVTNRGGNRIIIFRKRRGGTLCGCIDPVIGKSTKSMCPVCFGTGWSGGYYPGIVTPSLSNVTQEMIIPTQEGNIHPQIGSFYIGNYPLVNSDDIVVEQEGKRWKVVNVDRVSYRGFVISQLINSSLIAPGEAEYMFTADKVEDTGWIYYPKSDLP